MRRFFVIALLLALPAVAQPPEPASEPAAPAVPVPRPAEVWGPGVETPDAAAIHRYFRALGEASPRVWTETLGSTEEGRDLLLAVVASEDRQADLDRLIEINRALSDFRRTPPEEAQALAEGGVPFVYLLGALPGSVGDSATALAEAAYLLATSDQPEIVRLREGAITLITPLADPDAYDRWRQWRREHPELPGDPPWLGYYGSLEALDADPGFGLAATRAVAHVAERFRPHEVAAAPGSVTGIGRLLEAAVATGPELSMGAWARAERSTVRGEVEPPHAYLFPPDPARPAERARLAEALRGHGVESYRLQGELVLGGRLLPEGTLVVRTDQPGGDVARVLLSGIEPPAGGAVSPFAGRPGPLPVLLGVRGLEAADPAVLEIPVLGEDWPPPEEEGRRRRRREPPPEPPALLEPWPTAAPTGRVEGPGQDVFLLADHGQPALLTARVLLGDHQADAAETPFRQGGREAPAGSLLVYAPRAAVERVAAETGQVFESLLSVPSVPRHVVDLPRLGVLHTWTDTTSAGWLRLALDRARMPYELVSPGQVRKGDLRRRFDVLLFPDSGGDFERLVHGWAAAGETGAEEASEDVTVGLGFVGLGELERFLRRGGVLVTLGNAATPFVEGGLARPVDAAGSVEGGGAELRATAAWPEHPVTYGYGGRTAVRVGDAPLWQVDEAAWERVVWTFGESRRPAPVRRTTRRTPEPPPLVEEELPVAGLEEGALEEDDPDSLDLTVEEPAPEPVTAEALPAPWSEPGELVLWGDLAATDRRRLDGTPAVVDLPVGDGRLVLFAFDPFRGHLAASDFRLVWNVLLHWNDLP